MGTSQYGLLAIAAGIAMAAAGRSRHRRPDRSMPAFAPVWQAARFLTPAGVRWWVAGLGVALAGVAVTFGALPG